jgi:xylulose-5-phosphate/fructose-6-phosphate phosphoketolase
MSIDPTTIIPYRSESMDPTPKTQALRTATTPTGDSQGEEAPLSPDELRKLDAYWRASNYLSVGQIYLLDNALLKDPLKREHVKPRLLGHWGTSPGLNMLYVHLNRVIKKDDLNMIYVIGPGHGGPSLVAHAYLEGTYSEVYPEISQDAEGMQKLFKQFSFPGGIPNHVAPETPGSIHEGENPCQKVRRRRCDSSRRVACRSTRKSPLYCCFGSGRSRFC